MTRHEHHWVHASAGPAQAGTLHEHAGGSEPHVHREGNLVSVSPAEIRQSNEPTPASEYEDFDGPGMRMASRLDSKLVDAQRRIEELTTLRDGAARDAAEWQDQAQQAERLLFKVVNYAPMGHHLAATDEEWHALLRSARDFLVEHGSWGFPGPFRG